MTAGQLLAAYHALPEQVRDLLGMTDELLGQHVSGLAEFAGPGARLEVYLPEVFGNPQVTELLTDIADSLDALGGPLNLTLISAINDMLLAGSLVPTRETRAGGLTGPGHRRSIGTVTPDVLVRWLDDIARRLRNGVDPLAPGVLVGSTGYQPGQRLAERLTRLALLNLTRDARAKLHDQGLFQRLLRADTGLLAEAWYAASGAEKAGAHNTGAAAVNQLIRDRTPTVLALLVLGEGMLDHVDKQINAHRDQMQHLDSWHTSLTLASSRVRQARAIFAEIEASVRDLLSRGAAREEASAVLERQVARWAQQMQLLYAVCDLQDPSQVLARVGHNKSMPADTYRKLFAGLVRETPAPPVVRLADLAGRRRLWRDLVRRGGVLAISPARNFASGPVYVYLRAGRLADGSRVFTVSSHGDGADMHIPVAEFTGDWRLGRPGTRQTSPTKTRCPRRCCPSTQRVRARGRTTGRARPASRGPSASCSRRWTRRATSRPDTGCSACTRSRTGPLTTCPTCSPGSASTGWNAVASPPPAIASLRRWPSPTPRVGWPRCSAGRPRSRPCAFTWRPFWKPRRMPWTRAGSPPWRKLPIRPRCSSWPGPCGRWPAPCAKTKPGPAGTPA